MNMNILVLHGVNLNMFGRRDPAHYGTATLAEINSALAILAAELGATVDIFQTNHEGEMIERIHAAMDQNFAAAIINAGAWSHYSYALADALAMLNMPIVEAHMSNIYVREDFRRHSVLSPVVKGCIAGFGPDSYLLALRAAVSMGRGKMGRDGK